MQFSFVCLACTKVTNKPTNTQTQTKHKQATHSVMPTPSRQSNTIRIGDGTLVEVMQDHPEPPARDQFHYCSHRRLRCLVGPLLLLVAVGWFVFDAPYPRHHGPHPHHHTNNEVDIDSRYRDHWAPRYRHYHHFLLRAICLSAVLGLSALFLRCRRPASDQHSDDAECEQLYRRHGHGQRNLMNPRRAVMLLLAIFAVLILLQAFVAVPPPTPPPQVSAALSKNNKRAVTRTITDALEYVRRVVFDLPPPPLTPRRPMEVIEGENKRKEEGPIMLDRGFIMEGEREEKRQKRETREGAADENHQRQHRTINVDVDHSQQQAQQRGEHSSSLASHILHCHVPFPRDASHPILNAMRTTVGRMLLAGVVPPPPPVLPILDDTTTSNNNDTCNGGNTGKQSSKHSDRLFKNDNRRTQAEGCAVHDRSPPVFVVVLVVLLLTLRLALFLAIPVVLLRLLCACSVPAAAAFLAAQQNDDIEAEQLTTEKQLHTKCIADVIFGNVEDRMNIV